MRTILCIDDHQATLVTLSLIFRGAGYCCITASNYEQAERLFAADHVDLIVVDHGLPGVNGTSIATHLKKIRDVAVLMLTGSTDVPSKPASVDVLLPKPQPPPALLEAVATLLASREKA
jgi:two-component system, OmpR family, KDP operon response regulator KdpE